MLMVDVEGILVFAAMFGTMFHANSTLRRLIAQHVSLNLCHLNIAVSSTSSYSCSRQFIGAAD